jgi:hypothetical protein
MGDSLSPIGRSPSEAGTSLLPMGGYLLEVESYLLALLGRTPGVLVLSGSYGAGVKTCGYLESAEADFALLQPSVSTGGGVETHGPGSPEGERRTCVLSFAPTVCLSCISCVSCFPSLALLLPYRQSHLCLLCSKALPSHGRQGGVVTHALNEGWLPFTQGGRQSLNEEESTHGAQSRSIYECGFGGV